MQEGRHKNLAGAGAAVSIVLVAAIFLFSPGLAAIAGGILALGGFIFYDRIGRKIWESSVSDQLQKIETTERNLAGEVRQAANEIAVLRDQIQEQAKARTTTTKRARAVTPAELVFSRTDDEDRNAIFPGAPLGRRADESSARARSYGEIASDPDISDTAVKQLVTEALRSQRIEMFLQPVVRLPQRKIRFYEMFARVRARPGVYLPAGRYMKFSETATVREIDKLLLAECLEMLRTTANLERAAPFFINVTQASLKNTLFMKKLLAFLATHRDLAARMIFELRQDDYKTLDPAVAEVMKAMAKLGCSFSIDNVRTLEFDVTALQRLNIRYIKIPAKNFFPALKSARELAELTRTKRKLEGNGIAVIAEKIEDEPMLRELADFDIGYGQGFLFGRPDLQGAYQNKSERVRRSG